MLLQATTLLSAKSDLHLVPEYRTGGPRSVQGAITVLYGDLTGDAAATFAEELGQGGPAFAYNGLISSGEITILTGRSQAEDTLPAENSDKAHAVLVHELAHTLGVSHSAPGASGLMTPQLNPDDLVLSAGDEFALRTIGCPSDENG